MPAGFLYDEALTRNILREDHILRPMRLRLVYELLQAYGVFQHPNALLIPPRIATPEELQDFHTRDYVEAVQAFSRGERLEEQRRYNFSDTGDNTVNPGMYEAAALAAGASLRAAEAVWSGEAAIAFNAGGGFHHAMPGYASGFCIFNDPVLAIRWLVKQGARVVYVDIDAHHGDGVQSAFYDTDQVMTISLHESGRYLFPNTGGVEEMGKDAGYGYSVNVPLAPHTVDETYLWAFRQVVPPLVRSFKPDVLATQLGVDTHVSDPLTHLALTSYGHREAVRELSRLSPGKWVAFGGGGYDLSAVTRCWTLDFATMVGIDLPDIVPAAFQEKYGLERVHDPHTPRIDNIKREFARRMAEESVEAIRERIFPLHGMS